MKDLPGARFVAAVLLVIAFGARGEEPTADPAEAAEVLQPITVHAQRVANLQPAGTFATTVTALRFDPQLDVQSRGLPEGQSDIAVHGGLFENTGFRIGAVTIFDPQTGHYSVELPIDPDMLSAPEVLTGLDNGLSAFNASVATIRYDVAPVRGGGRIVVGAGTDGLRHGKARAAAVHALPDNRQLGLAVSAAASAGDGTVPFGDHDFKRFTGQVAVSDESSETQLILGYHDRFFGWPGAYTGFASLPETDHTRLGLILLDHRRHLDHGWWQVTAAYRWLDDDYDFDRRTQESGRPGSFEHETRAAALGLSGQLNRGAVEWNFSGQLSADRLVRSTDLTAGDFSSRNYLTAAVVPAHRRQLTPGRELVVQGGVRADFSNRDENALMPLLGVRLEQDLEGGTGWLGLEYSRNTQVPGYTALKSPPRGLFGGNAALGREFADTVALVGGIDAADWWVRATVFHRRDDGLVDWTYRAGAPFARQANAVDIDVNGFEALLGRQFGPLDVTASYAALNKDENYRDAAVDASFYALNFARHRLTMALRYRPHQRLEVRFDNEYRRQRENALRSGPDNAYQGALSVSWQPVASSSVWLTVMADNLSDSDFQEFPGTPAAGRQVSLSLGLGW